MTKEEFNEKFESIINDGFIEKYMREKKDLLLNYGAINIQECPNDYSLVKDVIVAILERLAVQYSAVGCSKSIQRESKRRIKRIKFFI